MMKKLETWGLGTWRIIPLSWAWKVRLSSSDEWDQPSIQGFPRGGTAHQPHVKASYIIHHMSYIIYCYHCHYHFHHHIIVIHYHALLLWHKIKNASVGFDWLSWQSHVSACRSTALEWKTSGQTSGQGDHVNKRIHAHKWIVNMNIYISIYIYLYTRYTIILPISYLIYQNIETSATCVNLQRSQDISSIASIKPLHPDLYILVRYCPHQNGHIGIP